MKVLRLRIEQDRAQISVDTQNAQLHVKTRKRGMKIVRTPPKMVIRRKRGGVKFNMDEFRANMGLKNNRQLLRDMVQRAYYVCEQGIYETVSRADFVGDVTRSGNRIGESARNKMLAPADIRANHSPVPPGIDMEGTPGSQEIEWVGAEISIEWEDDWMPEMYVEPPCSLKIELTQRPKLHISLVEEYIPPVSGRKVSMQA